MTLAVPPLLLAEWRRLSGGYTLADGTTVRPDDPVPLAYNSTLADLKAAIETRRLELVTAGLLRPQPHRPREPRPGQGRRPAVRRGHLGGVPEPRAHAIGRAPPRRAAASRPTPSASSPRRACATSSSTPPGCARASDVPTAGVYPVADENAARARRRAGRVAQPGDGRPRPRGRARVRAPVERAEAPARDAASTSTATRSRRPTAWERRSRRSRRSRGSSSSTRERSSRPPAKTRSGCSPAARRPTRRRASGRRSRSRARTQAPTRRRSASAIPTPQPPSSSRSSPRARRGPARTSSWARAPRGPRVRRDVARKTAPVLDGISMKAAADHPVGLDRRDPDHHRQRLREAPSTCWSPWSRVAAFASGGTTQHRDDAAAPGDLPRVSGRHADEPLGQAHRRGERGRARARARDGRPCSASYLDRLVLGGAVIVALLGMLVFIVRRTRASEAPSD